jgi:UDP-N-acetylmuramoyl-tripeptide--D-alanyl-D-alanine ligase
MRSEELYHLYRSHPGVTTDSRSLTPGQLYFALKGDRFNGNRFAREALAQGAAFAVVDEDTGFHDDRLIRVDDVLQCLQQLALHHRRRFDIPVIAITGSNGKTTTKELVHAVLASRYRTHTTRGNLNNHIGIPLTLLSMPAGTEIAVIEMGANHQREIAGYCRFTEPTHGIITNCGKAHIEGFGGEAGVRRGKGELYDHLRAHRGTAFYCSDQAYLTGMIQGIGQVVSYGSHDADITGTCLRSEPFLELSLDGRIVSTRLVGAYNLPNVLAAVAVGRHFQVPESDITLALEGYTPSNSRSQLIRTAHGNEVILDAYNANPTSMRAAIDNLVRQQHPRKAVVLGAMMELGDESIAEHQAIVALLQTAQWERVLLVGGDFTRFDHPYPCLPDADSAAETLARHPLRDALVLVKGSRSMTMEKVLPAL